MLIKVMQLSGFKSFTNEQTFVFQQYVDGLFLVSGKNLVDVELTSNGTGKTSIFDALCWCLYGATPNRLKSNNLINWNCTAMSVSLQFEQHGQDYILLRESPNKITINEKQVVQSVIDELVDINLQTFIYSTLIPCDVSAFFDLRSEEKLEVLESALNLDMWIKCSEEAKRKGKELQGRIERHENIIRGEHGGLSALRKSIKANTERHNNWQSETAKRIKVLKVSVMDCDGEIEAVGKKIKERKKLFKSAEMKVDKRKKHLITSKKSITDNEVFTNNNNVNHELKRQNYLNTQKIRDKFSKMQNKCIECQQTIDDKYKSKQLTILNKEVDNASKEYQTAAEQLVDFKIIKKTLIKVEDEACHNYSTALMEFDAQKGIINNWGDKRDSALRNKKKMLNDIVRIKNKKSIYQDLIDADNVEIVRAEEVCEYNGQQAKKLKDEAIINLYWSKSFKEIRLLVIDSILTELEIFSNNYLIKLGMKSWHIKYSLHKKNKYSNVNKGFTISIKSPDSDSHVPFKVFSAGEKQRLRLSGSLALMDVLNTYTGSYFNLEVYDEPTQHLSNDGINDLLELLRDRAKEQQKTIFVVDHRNFEAKGIFDGWITVVKTDKGSKIE